jgi:hypothetical protein
MEAVNVQFAVYTKQGVLVQSVNGSQFFSAGKDFIGDPRVLFDSASGRWFASVFDNNIGGSLVAVSMSSNPTANWTVYKFVSGGLDDQPIIGVTSDKFILSINQYVSLTGPFLGAHWWVVNKNDMLLGVTFPSTVSFGPYPSLMSVHPVQSLSPTTTAYMVSSGGADLAIGANRTAVFVVSVTGTPPGSVVNQTVAVPVSTIIPTVLAPQNGASNKIDTGVGKAAGAGDARIQSASWYNGKLWLTFPVSCTPTGDNQTRACFRLIQIDTNSNPPRKLQDFDVGVSGLYLFYPALTVDSLGNLGVIYGFSSPTIYPSLGVTGQRVTDPANTFMQPLTVKAGSASEGTDRYGDYFSAVRDPSDQMLLWFGGEYHDQSVSGCNVNCWSTFISSDRVLNSGFAVSTNPTYLTTIAGIASSSKVNVTSLTGYSGTVSLTAVPSSTSISISLSPQQVTVSSNSFSLATLSITTTSSTPPGIYTIQINATGIVAGKQLTLPAAAVLVVPRPDFTIAALPKTLFYNPLSSPSSTISVTSTANFAGTVTLTNSISPSGITVTINPGSLTLSANQTGTSTLNLASSSFGAFTVNVTATSGSLVHWTILTIIIGGALCIADPTTSPTSACSGPVQTFNGPLTTPNTLLRVGVFVQGSGSLAAVTITLVTNHAVLNSFGVDFTGSLLSSAQPVYVCLGAREGYPACSGTRDTIDTITVSASMTPTSSPISGLLFTAIYNITGPATNQPITFLTSPNCSNSSVPGTNYCLFLNSGFNVLDYEALASAPSFTNGNPAFVTLSSSPSIIGPILANALGTSTITASAQNGWPGFSADQVTFTTQQSVGLTASVPQLSCITGGTSCSVTLQVNAAAGGNYFVTVFGTYTFTDPNTFFASTFEAPVMVEVVVTDFSVSLSPTTLNIQQGATATSTVTLASLNGFAGTITLSVRTPTGVTSSFSPSSITLSSGGTGSSVLMITVGSTVTRLNYTQSLTASSGSISRLGSVGIQISNFKITTSTNTLLIPVKSSGTLTITATSLNGYSGTVTPVINSGLPSCVTYSFNPTTIQLPAHGAATSTLTLTPGATCAASTNSVSGQGNSGTTGFGFSFVLNVTDFVTTASPTSVTVLAGASGLSTITLSPLSGFTGTVSLSAFAPNGLTCTTSPQSVTLGAKQNSTLSCSGSAGNYNVTVTGTVGSLSHSTTVSYTVQDFSAVAPGSVTCVLGGRRGNICSFSVTVTSVNGFAGTVCMSSSASVSPSCVTLSAGGSKTVTVTFAAGPSTVIVTYTSGSLSHQTSTHIVYVQ